MDRQMDATDILYILPLQTIDECSSGYSIKHNRSQIFYKQHDLSDQGKDGLESFLSPHVQLRLSSVRFIHYFIIRIWESRRNPQKGAPAYERLQIQVYFQCKKIHYKQCSVTFSVLMHRFGGILEHYLREKLRGEAISYSFLWSVCIIL